MILRLKVLRYPSSSCNLSYVVELSGRSRSDREDKIHCRVWHALHV